MKPLLSIIIPVYQVADYLDRCLQSVKAGGVEAMEVWLIDDASTDESVDICKQWVAADERFHLLRHSQNKGLSAARNTGLDYAQGKYVCFVDSDDFLDPNTLQEQVKLLEANPDVNVVEYPISINEGSPHLHHLLSFSEEQVLSFSEWLVQDGCGHSYACNKVFRRSLWNGIRFPEGVYFEDLHTIPTVLHRAGKMLTATHGCYHYLYHAGTISRVPDCKHLSHLLQGQHKAYRLLCEVLGTNHSATQYLYMQMANTQISLLAQHGAIIMPYRKISLCCLYKHTKATPMMMAKGLFNNMIGLKYMYLWSRLMPKK